MIAPRVDCLVVFALACVMTMISAGEGSQCFEAHAFRSLGVPTSGLLPKSR